MQIINRLTLIFEKANDFMRGLFTIACTQKRSVCKGGMKLTPKRYLITRITSNMQEEIHAPIDIFFARTDL